MLECAIPTCCRCEKFFRSGTLHLMDTVREDGTVVKKMIWLCAECTRRYVVQGWRAPGEQIRLREPAISLQFGGYRDCSGDSIPDKAFDPGESDGTLAQLETSDRTLGLE